MVEFQLVRGVTLPLGLELERLSDGLSRTRFRGLRFVHVQKASWFATSEVGICEDIPRFRPLVGVHSQNRTDQVLFGG